MDLNHRPGRPGDAAPRARRSAGLRPTLGFEALEPRRPLAAGAFGLNVEIDPYSSLVNWLQFGGRFGGYDSSPTAPTLNSSGDPEGDASLIFDYRVNRFFNGPDPEAVPPDLSGTYHLSFNGQATITSANSEPDAPFTVQDQIYDPSTNTTTADLVIPAGNTQDLFVISFADTRATAASPVDTGFSNARLIRPGYAADSTQLYTDQFLQALQPYSALRYLDPSNTNGQPFFTNNTLDTVDASQVDQTGAPWEYLVALANQTHTDMWINVPQGATDDYVAALAGIIENGGTVDGVSYPGLDPSLKVYVEYSNEVWGGIPFNEYYQEAAVEDTADNHPLSTFSGNLDVYDNPDGTTTTDIPTAVARRYVEETAHIGQIFQSVMGADPTHQRIRPVLSWQGGNTALEQDALPWYEHFFGPIDSAIYGMGDSGYVGPTDYSSVASVLSTLQAAETAYTAEVAGLTTVDTYYGLANVSYEGGPSVSGDGTAAGSLNGLAASRDPAMESIVFQHFLDFYAAGGTLAMAYNGPYAAWAPGNEWGVAEPAQYDDPMAAPKYRGTADVAEAPAQAVTAGEAISSATSTSFDAAVDSLGDSFAAPATGQQAFWLLDVAQGGTYDLTLSTGSWGGGSTSITVEVLLDDKPVGTIVAPPGAATADLGNLTLPTGLATVSLVAEGGQFAPVSLTLTPSNPTTSSATAPSWLAPGSAATFDPTTDTLTVTGAATIIADPGIIQAPYVVATGPAAVLTIQPALVGAVNLRGITLGAGASIVVPSVGAGRTHAYHVVVVLDSDGSAAPPFSIDPASTLDLADNDLIIQHGGSEFAAIQADADLGRDLAAGGTWDGNGLTSSAAEAADASAGFEQDLLALTVNSDLPMGPYATWLAGPQVLDLNPDDVIVKYTYNGDFDLNGAVDDNDEGILGLFYGTTSGATYVDGDTDGNGTVDDDDYALFGLDYGLGTGGSNGNNPL